MNRSREMNRSKEMNRDVREREKERRGMEEGELHK